MADDMFDVLIVGAGLAGCTAGLMLAREGLEVLIIERGNYAGSKNMTGGRLYAHSLERIIPGFADEAPVERLVTREKISFLTGEQGATMEYQHPRAELARERSYTILRGRFDQWLMGKAEEAGVQFIPGVRVENLIMEGGRVTGVQAGEDKLEARVIILADGVNSILAEKCGLTQPVAAKNVAVGVKELIELPRTTLEDRFGLAEDEGLAWLFAGSPSDGMMGGGFLYTNEDTISLGLVCGLHHIERARKSVPQMLEDFKGHPLVAPLVKGGKLVEYSAHVVPEGGLGMVPKLVGNGVLIAGDAAGLCLNVGYTIRGMDLAVASGEAAARAVLDAKKRNDYSEAGLSLYQTLLDESFVMRDMRLYKNLPEFMENPRLFSTYPDLVTGLMQDLFTVDGSPAIPVWKKGLHRARKAGIWSLLKDGMKGVRSL